MKSTPLALALLICLTSGAIAQSPVPEQILRIDPDNVSGGTATKMLAETEYIPLETSKASLFNKIDHLEVTSRFFIILDRQGNSILLFDKTGKFVRRIDPPGKSNDPFQPPFQGFSVDHPRQEIVVTSGIKELAGYFLVYDMNGQLLRKQKKLAADVDASVSMGNGWILSNTNTPLKRGTSTPQLVIESEDKVEKEWLPFDPQSILDGNDRFLHGKFLYHSGNETYFFRNYYNYQLVELDRQHLRKIYRIILPASFSLPQNFLTDTLMEGKRMQYAVQNPEKVFCFSDIYRTGDKLLFKLALAGNTFRDRSLIHDLKSGQTFTLHGLQPDSSNNYLPLFDIIGDVLACDGDNCFASVSALDMYNAQDRNASRKPAYPPHIAQFLAQKDRLANPVILRFRFKQAL